MEDWGVALREDRRIRWGVAPQSQAWAVSKTKFSEWEAAGPGVWEWGDQASQVTWNVLVFSQEIPCAGTHRSSEPGMTGPSPQARSTFQIQEALSTKLLWCVRFLPGSALLPGLCAPGHSLLAEMRWLCPQSSSWG